MDVGLFEVLVKNKISCVQLLFSPHCGRWEQITSYNIDGVEIQTYKKLMWR